MSGQMLAIIMVGVGALLLLLVLRSLLSLDGIKLLVKGVLMAALLLAGLVALFSGLDLYRYRALLQEERVATLYFEQERPQLYRVRVTYEGQQVDRATERFHLRGDDWQLDVRLLKWHPRLAAAGLPPMYHLDRLSGRYRNVAQAVSTVPTVHSLYQPVAGFDSWQWAQDIPVVQRLLDSRYGSATYLPMGHGALYQVTLGSNGLIARPMNKPAEEAVKHWQ